MSLKQLSECLSKLLSFTPAEVHGQGYVDAKEMSGSEVLLALRAQALEGKPDLETRAKLWEMLTENTGAHFLDSGGAYGRSWEQHQMVDFEAQPEVSLSFRHEYMEFTRSTYHWLAANLTYEKELTKHLYQLGSSEKYEDECWGECIAAWMKSKVPDAAGAYGEGEPYRDNTYNHENILDQTLLFTWFTIPGTCNEATKLQVERWGETFLILQIHGGCDVRGGYTSPVIFSWSGDCETGFLNWNDWNVAVDPDTMTEAPDPKQLQLDGKPATFYVPRWSNQEGVSIDENNSINPDWDTAWQTQRGLGWEELSKYDYSEDKADRGKGVIYVDDDGNGYCPHTGGKLIGYCY